MWVSYTIYPRGMRQGVTVGMTIKPTPSLSYLDLLNLIQELNKIEREMRSDKRSPIKA